MSWPPTRQDLFNFGLPSEACVPDARQLDSVQVSANLFELRGHGFGGGEMIRMVGRAGGTPPAIITGPTVWNQVAPTSDNDFFALVGLTLGDAGTGAFVAIENFNPKIDAIISTRASWLVSWYKAGQGPWSVAPVWAPMIVAHLAAPDVANALRIPSSRYDTAGVEKRFEAAMTFLDKIDKGEPYNDGVGPIDATPTVNEAGAATVRLRRGDFDLKRHHGECGELDIA